jgi:hypothetical protein
MTQRLSAEHDRTPFVDVSIIYVFLALKSENKNPFDNGPEVKVSRTVQLKVMYNET